MAKLKDVARLSGVTPGTASRVLRNEGYVGDETRSRVEEAARALGYRPNPLAQSLKTRRTDFIALIVPNILNEIFAAIAQGVEDTARKNGVTVILCNTENDLEVEKKCIAELKSRWIDGFIVASMTQESDHIRALRNDGFPVVLTSRHYGDELDAVVVDNFAASREAVRHLVRTGHKNIALAMGREDFSIHRDRKNGYLAALEENGIPARGELIVRETFGSDSLYYAFCGLLRRGVPFDAVFAVSDYRAYVVMRALRDAGLSVPEDVSVLGFDNIDTAPLFDVPLSTVSQPLHRMGVHATNMLLERIEHKARTGALPPPVIDVMPTELVIRKSTR